MNNLQKYLSALKMINKMKLEGLIDEEEYIKSESYLASKYCIKKDSLFRPKDLINTSFRVIYIHDQKEEKCNEKRSEKN